MEEIVSLIDLVLNPYICKFKNELVQFLKQCPKKVMQKDGWDQIGAFIKDIDGDLSNVVPNSYYHTIVDEFLEYMIQRKLSK